MSVSSAAETPRSYREDPACPGYWFYGDLRIQADVETHHFVVDYARRNLPAGTEVLDVAVGEGALMQQLRDAGLRPVGTSWNDKCRVTAPTFRLDLDRPFSTADVGGKRFALVCGIEIIEHLENPASFLRHCADLLAPGGRLVVSTPNVESAAARLQWLVRGRPELFGRGEIEHNRHISMMWREGIEYLIELAGFSIAEKHLLGAFRLRPGVFSAVKRLAYGLMGRFLPGDTRGTTRLYVLALSEDGPRALGPTDVY
jgi:SAM-dependent methyltransferase